MNEIQTVFSSRLNLLSSCLNTAAKGRIDVFLKGLILCFDYAVSVMLALIEPKEVIITFLRKCSNGIGIVKLKLKTSAESDNCQRNSTNYSGNNL